MAIVFLATDLKHHRRVAIKVLKPELATALGADRFLREIEIASSLNHPHILPLFDSGEADGLLYFVAPFIEGQSLRDRLNAEHQLPVEEAVELTRQVAAALAYAHGRGLLHRDIKPENILLAQGEAVVADFGIARAVEEAAERRLTQTGIVIGTPAYMSPEQGTGTPVDARSDLYSLACVLYELLAGQPPFTSPTAHALLAQHSLDQVPSIRAARPAVPPALEAVIGRALAKLPADRFQSVAEFSAALAAAVRTPALTAPPAQPRGLRRALPAGLALAALAGLAVWSWHRYTSAGRPRLDPQLILVLPFQIGGAVDTTLVSPEGMVDLVATRLAGEAGARAVYPGSAVRAWLRAGGTRSRDMPVATALQVARELGAGQVLLGRAFGAPERLELSGSLVGVGRGETVAAARVSGSSDSLLALLDQLLAKILLQTAGPGQRRLEQLTTDRLPALRAYLGGLEKYRRGQYREAARLFNQALEEDSAFALAGLALAAAENAVGRVGERERGVAIAWAHRARLSSADRLFLAALVGPRYPSQSSLAEVLAAWERAVDSLPDRWEVWYELADMLFHYGTFLGKPEPLQRAATAFQKVLEADSAFAPALEHLVDLAISAGDTSAVRRLGTRYLAVDSSGDHADYVRWRMAVALGDSVLHQQVRQNFSGMDAELLDRIVGTAQLDGLGLNDAAAASAALFSQPRSEGDLFVAAVLTRNLLLNRGRPRAAAAVRVDQATSLPFEALFSVIEALYWDGDSALASAAARERARFADAPIAAGAAPDPSQALDLCTVSLWRMAQGQHITLDEAVKKLRRIRAPLDNYATASSPICAAILEAQLAEARRRPEAAAAVERLDSLMLSGPTQNPYLVLAGNLTVARLRLASGDRTGALAATRRRINFYINVAGLSTLLRMEGQLAAAVGDTAGAIRAYRHYLALRTDPEPVLQPAVRQVRTALQALAGDGSH
jgi:serine/threonine-protein kinase